MFFFHKILVTSTFKDLLLKSPKEKAHFAWFWVIPPGTEPQLQPFLRKAHTMCCPKKTPCFPKKNHVKKTKKNTMFSPPPKKKKNTMSSTKPTCLHLKKLVVSSKQRSDPPNSGCVQGMEVANASRFPWREFWIRNGKCLEEMLWICFFQGKN